ncbi:MAG: NADH-quinone oxidoreductase subunit NuoG [Deltaproteobacteria bacterium]|jgi:NADH-quinone oxidoreductase subunit G
MPTIYIEGLPYEAKEGQNLLHVCLSLGFNIPYFCWHPAMGSVGACRLCAVKLFKDENDHTGKIVMACLTPAKDGTRISIEDPEVKRFRARMIELLMNNHPHDCPVCDEGGECHLQDMTTMTGHTYRRFRFKKRTYRNQDLGPFIRHEMNRCIHCYRCIRFYREYAGGTDLAAFGAHNRVYFGRHADGPLESEFSGNLVEVCPTGVFTDKISARHYTRKWDLQTAPSICVHCGLGCNILPAERSGELCRIRNRYNADVNGYFICDRGRYGYMFVNHPRRIRRPLLKSTAGDAVAVEADPASKDVILRRLADLLSSDATVIGIGSPRASLEANFALRTLVGPENFYLGMSDQDHELVGLAVDIHRNGPARSPSLRDLELADAMLILGEDITNTAPMLALSLRHWLRRRQTAEEIRLGIPYWNDAAIGEIVHEEPSPLYVATTHATKLDAVAAAAVHTAPDQLAQLGFAVAHALSASVPAAADLDAELQPLATEIADKLNSAKRPIILSGTGLGSAGVMQAAVNVAWALCAGDKTSELCLVVPECNSLGLRLMGGRPLSEALKAVESGRIETAIVLENDLFRRAPSAVIEQFMNGCRHLIVLDHLLNTTASRADVVLPAATFAESSGTLVNNEGRLQRFYQVFVPGGEIQPSWSWLRDMMALSRRPEAEKWQHLDDVLAAMAEALPDFSIVPRIAPPAAFRIAGMKIPRQPFRYSGRTAIKANVSIHEPQPPIDDQTPLCFSMEGSEEQPPSSLITNYWAPGWNSVQALNRFQQEVGGQLHGGDPGRRLFEFQSCEQIPYFTHVPTHFELSKGQWLVVAIHHIFGSEELSLLAPGIAQRAPEPYIGLNNRDMAQLGLQEGELARFIRHDATYRLPVRLVPSLPHGIAGLPVGLPATQGLQPPFRAQLSPDSNDPHG